MPRRVCRLLPELTCLPRGCASTFFIADPRNSPGPKFHWQKSKTIRHTCGTSVNDVILALVTATIRRYLELHGDRVKGRMFRMMVPVNLRGNDSPGELGNRISLVPVTIPLDIRNPRKLLAAVHQENGTSQTRAYRRIGEFGRRFDRHVPHFGAGGGRASSSAGCRSHLSTWCAPMCRGRNIRSTCLATRCCIVIPMFRSGGEMALNCAILTYNGTAYFGFSGDVHAAPDLRRLEALLKSSFTELRDGRRESDLRKEAKKETRKNMYARRRKLQALRVPQTGGQSVRRFAAPVRLGCGQTSESSAARLVRRKS